MYTTLTLIAALFITSPVFAADESAKADKADAKQPAPPPKEKKEEKPVRPLWPPPGNKA